MSQKNALFPRVKDYIAFETLWSQVTETITALSGEHWTDTGEHDPGITLLEATTWNSSDLSYRASLSLNDLLTREGEEVLFPKEFGPDRTLTCNTITAEDYRRALRDLHSDDMKEDPLLTHDKGFLFSDACLIKEPLENRFSWWYDISNRAYSFAEPEVDEKDKKKITLRGNYRLYLLPTRFTNLLDPSKLLKLKAFVANFLTNHRNLGEYVSRIVWLQPCNFNPELTIELSEDVSDVNRVVAQIYQTLESQLTPGAVRQTTEQLQRAGYANEAIFEGPLLQHGWQQPSAPLITENGITLNLSFLFKALLNIAGVASIRSFSPGELPSLITPADEGNWSWRVAKGYFPLLWGDDPLSKLASVNSPLTLIAKGGIVADIEQSEVAGYLTTPEPIQNKPVTLEAGKVRDLAAYTPIGTRLPECYRLQEPDEVIDDSVRELHQFLLPADQQLADGCAGLAALPQLLAFTGRDKFNAIRGTRWPYRADSVSQQVHKDYAGYLIDFEQNDAAILKNDGINAENFSRELDFLQYLLGYFGTSRAAMPMTLDMVDFLKTERAYLAQQPALGYDRINIRIDEVSALQKRIAARIGLNSECFSPEPDLAKLPFYLIEHRQLLPLPPNVSYNEEQTPGNFTVDKPNVTVTQKGSAGKLVRGQLIDLIAIEGESSRLSVGPLLIIDTSGDSFTVSTANSQQLLHDLDRLQKAWDSKKLNWRNSNTWLQDMDYRLNYAEKQPGDKNQRLLISSAQSPFPTMVAEGDKITIRIADAQLASARVASPGDNWSLEATIVALDTIQGTLLIEKTAESTNDFPAAENAWRYQWNFSEASYATEDRFSFVVSIVHNLSMIQSVKDKQSLLDWLQRAIMAEFPAHVSLINLWLDNDAFQNFAQTYARWQHNGNPLGDDAFAIMEMLTLGHLPVTRPGVGLMRIATEEQRTEAIGSDGSEWHTDIIQNEELFNVPKDVAPV